MEVLQTGIKDLLILKPKIFEDPRGYFFESYNQRILSECNIDIHFLQDNEAMSSKNTFRGFHYQLPPFAQTKLVRVISGRVFDIAIDIRPDSETYGKHYGIELSAENKLQFLVPQGFAHGYLCLEDNTIFAYKVDQYYSRAHEHSISYLDPELKIAWPSPPANFLVSDKDKLSPPLDSHVPYE